MLLTNLMVRILATTGLLAVTVFSTAASAAPSPAEIVQKADDARIPSGSVVFEVSVKDFEKGSMSRETRYKVYNKGSDASLVETQFPERQKGRKLLMQGDSLWFYTPDIKRPARVSMQQKLTGEISNGDLARTNYSGDYEAELVGTEDVNGKKAYHLNLKAKRSGVTYSKLEYWVGQSDFVPLKVIFYAVSGKKLKTGTYSDVKTVLGQKCITKLEVTDATDTKRKSILVYSKHVRTEIPDSVLNKESLSE